MSWNDWAQNIVAAGGSDAGLGAAIYCPSSGAIWGKFGPFECSGNLAQYDMKAAGKDASCPEVNGVRYMFIRKTLDDEPVSIFKKDSDSLFTTKGPSGSRVAVQVTKQKPEPFVSAISNYLKPHV